MFLLQDFLQRGVLSMEEARCVVLCWPKTVGLPRGDFSPSVPSIDGPGEVFGSGWSRSNAGYGYLGTRWEVFFFWNFQKKKQQQKGPKGGVISIFVLLEDVHVMVGYVFSFWFGRKSAKVDYQTKHGWRVFRNLNLTIPRWCFLGNFCAWRPSWLLRRLLRQDIQSSGKKNPNAGCRINKSNQITSQKDTRRETNSKRL